MNRRSRACVMAGLALGLAVAHVAGAHPGRTNASGCHNDRRTGGYHCHGGSWNSGGGWSEPAVQPTRFQVVAIPRARVWINDTYVGLSPTRTVRVAQGKVKVRLEHAALGHYETTADAPLGETTELTVRW